jgi:hypothetical protein
MTDGEPGDPLKKGSSTLLPDSYTRQITATVTHKGSEVVMVTGTIEDPDHLMVVEMDVDVPTRTITRSRLEMSRARFPACREAMTGGDLTGLRLERGFSKKAGALVGGKTGCAHLYEAVMAAARLASSAVIAVASGAGGWDSLYQDDPEFRKAMDPYLKDTCVVFQTDAKYNDHDD